MSGSEWADPLGDLRRAARKVAAEPRRMLLDPALVSMTPEVKQKLGTAPPPDPLFPDFEAGFPLMERLVREAMRREDEALREALRKLRAAEAPAHPQEQERMEGILSAAVRYADVYRITWGEALGVFARFAGLEK